jgi:hypothetical protein
MAGLRQGKSGRFGDFAQELVGRLHEDAGPVPGVFLATAGSTVGKAFKDIQSLEDDLVGLFILDIGDKAYAAGIFSCVEGRQPFIIIWNAHKASDFFNWLIGTNIIEA